MAKGTGKSGVTVAEEHVQSLIAVLERYRERPLPRSGVELNKSAIARECGFDRKVFQTNPRCADLLDRAEREDRERHLNRMDQAELRREEAAKTDKDRAELEAQNLRLMAENASLRLDLERFRRLERLMAETGKLPS
jgi:hypothetical protein